MVEVDFADVGHLLGCALFVEAIDRNKRAMLELTNPHICKDLLSDSGLA